MSCPPKIDAVRPRSTSTEDDPKQVEKEPSLVLSASFGSAESLVNFKIPDEDEMLAEPVMGVPKAQPQKKPWYRIRPRKKYQHCPGKETKVDAGVDRQSIASTVSTPSYVSREYEQPNITKPQYSIQQKTQLKQKWLSSSEERSVVPESFSRPTSSDYKGMGFPVATHYRDVLCRSSSTFDFGRSPVPTPEPQRLSQLSHAMDDTEHKFTWKKEELEGPEWRKPCNVSFEAGAPKRYIGACPANVEDTGRKMMKQKFFLTQDPRKNYCLRNPADIHRKPLTPRAEFFELSRMVKQADNLCAPSESSRSSDSFICQVMDVENPLQLDFQGLDCKATYEKDEQDIQNQRVYRRVCRYMERRRVQAETARAVEEQLHHERLAVPECFTVTNREVQEPIESPVPSIRYGKLFRAADKPFNERRIAEESRHRRERYSQLYIDSQAKKAQKEKKRKKKLEDLDDHGAILVAEQYMRKTAGVIDDTIARITQKQKRLKKIDIARRVYPHTMRETVLLKRKMKEENRINREKARIKKQFYKERVGVEKRYPEADLEISSDEDKQYRPPSPAPLSEQSSDDEDNMKVGTQGDVFKLRGFHFKLGDNVRGRLHTRELNAGHRPEKRCLTREEWLNELAPKREPLKLDALVGMYKKQDPNDVNLNLFPQEFGLLKSHIKVSPVKQFIKKRLGRQYDRTLRKRIKIAKPRLNYTVRKFNLISFLYGEKHREMLKDTGFDLPEKPQPPESTLEYIASQARLREQRHAWTKAQRMKLLGLPCQEFKKSRLQSICENSESDSDHDWVPPAESDETTDDEERMTHLRKGRVPMRMRGNMPAPFHRETTLRQHPRHPRNYHLDRVPSKEFDEVVNATHHPHMRKMPEDLTNWENLNLKNRPYTKLFHARHHHDHWDPTQRKMVDVHYHPHIVQPKATQIQKKEKMIIETFTKATPPCAAKVHEELTIRHPDIPAIIEEQLKLNEKPRGETVATEEVVDDECQPYHFVFHSRPVEEVKGAIYEGHQQFLDFLVEVRDKLYDTRDEGEKEKQRAMAAMREDLIKELEGDLKSIASCLSSLESSECTNLTHDSGSYLLVEGKNKVPMDYIRKSVVPFEELQRSRFRFEPINVEAEEANPFKVMPFSGQRKASLDELKVHDKFFTYNTRLQNTLRARLEVPVTDAREHLLGFGEEKHPGRVATDIDEYYVEALRTGAPCNIFKFNSGRSLMKETQRLKYESLLITGQIVRGKIYDRMNEKHYKHMHLMSELFEALFRKWEKREYETSMKFVYKVKSFYDMSDVLRSVYRELERQVTILNMDIVFIEGQWIKSIMLQNFLYLVGDQDWRYANDWMHRNPDNEKELEDYDESIRKRPFLFVRPRDQDDAYAIRNYFVDVFLPNKRPILQVFNSTDEFFDGIELLKSKTFVLLLELHFTLNLHTELRARLQKFMEWCTADLEGKQEFVNRKSAKRLYMANRAETLHKRTIEYMGEPLRKSYRDRQHNKNRALITEVWRQIVPGTLRGSSSYLPTIDMVAMMSDVVVELMSRFEPYSMDMVREVEKDIRRRRKRDLKLSRQAYVIEKRIEIEMRKVVKNMEPPYVKPKREGKLPFLVIKKRPQKVTIDIKPLSDHTKCFLRAFKDDDDDQTITDARSSLYAVDNMQEQIVPFYFDHFLKLNGYTPNYNFKTNVELRDGLEYDRFKVRGVLPAVQERVEQWEYARKKKMEDTIARNPKMYENVNF